MDEQATIADLEHRLAESEARHRLLIDSWARAVWETDAHGVVVADSPSWRAYTGQALEEWLGYGWLDAIHPDDRALAERQWRDATAARGLVDAEFRLRAPDGGLCWTNVRAAPVLDGSGNIERWAGINIDIDARKLAEVALRESEELRRIAVEGGRMGTWRWDLRDEIVWGDAAFLELWGFPPSDEPRRLIDFTDRMSPQGRDEMGELVPPAIAAAEEFDGQLAVVGGPTSGRWVRWRGRAERERPWLVNGVSFDVTEQWQANKRLRESEERQAFLLKLSDALRPLADPAAIQETVSRITAEHLDLGRVAFCEIRYEPEVIAIVPHDWPRRGMPSVAAGRYRMDEWGKFQATELIAGRPAIVANAEADTRITAVERENWRALRIVASLALPVMKEGRFVAFLVANDDRCRDWGDDEIALLHEVSGRTWAAAERTRAEAALRESEEHLEAELRHTTLLRELAARLVTEESETAIYQEILSAAIAISKADAGTVQAYDPENRSLVLLVAEGIPDQMSDHFKRVDAASSTACGVALRTGQRSFVDFDKDQTDEACRLHVEAGYRSAQATPLLSRNGSPIGMLNTHWRAPKNRPSEDQLRFLDLLARQAADLIEGARAEAALRESEQALASDLANAERLRSLAERLVPEESFQAIYDEVLSATVAITRADAGTVQIYDSSTKALELIASVNFSRTITDYFQRVDAGSRTACGLALKTGERAFIDFPDEVADLGCQLLAGEGIQSAVAIPLVSRTGTPLGMLNAHWRHARRRPNERELRFLDLLARQAADLIERRQSERALHESEARLREFGEASQDVLWVRDAETLRWAYLTPAFETIYGISREAALEGDDFRNWMNMILPEDQAGVNEHIGRVRTGKRVTFEYRIRRPSDGEVRWLRDTDFPLFDAFGQVQRIGGIGQDVTEEKSTAERMDVLVGELQHRTRNLLGVVRTMSDETARASADLPGYRSRFGDRLAALARVQGLLSRLEEWDRVSFDELIHSELAVLDGGTERVTLCGPTGIALRSSTVQTFALAIHELMTTAMKYGALGQPQGSLAISWRLKRSDAADRPWLHVDWREAGVAMPAKNALPQGSGSGRDLIERALPYQLEAKTTFVMEADGVHCTIAVPVSERQAAREMVDA